jgi:hypothetical protein
VPTGEVSRKGDLYEGVPPTRKIASNGDFNREYNISPDGSKIAYFTDVRPLCVLTRAGPARCVDHATVTDIVSVNDSGEVLVAAGTGQRCVYSAFYDFSPAPAGQHGDEECLGIGYWKPGLKSVVILQPIGRNPQWLSPATAALMRSWSASETGLH